MGKRTAAKQDASASKVEGDQVAGDKTTTVEQPAPALDQPQAPAAPTGDHPGQGVHDASSAGSPAQ